jgi:transmembrane sensor
MKRWLDRIVVTPPSPEGARERVEARVMAALQRDGVGASPAPERPPGARRWLAISLVAMGVAGSAAAALLMVRGAPEGPQPEPMLAAQTITTGVGQGSRLTVEDAVVDVGSDTRVVVRPPLAGATVLELERGTVDCDVPPRPGRKPFRVQAGVVSVEVVGTRFAVSAHAGAVRVDVARGRVLVTAPGVRVVLAAGQSWSSEPAASNQGAGSKQVSNTAEPRSAPPPELEQAPPRPRDPTPSPQAQFARAQRLERTAPDAAVAIYRDLASGRDVWAALALYSLAELESARGHRGEAMRLLRQYEKRFPKGANAEETAWLSVEVLRSSGEPDSARRAAAAYLARYPMGAYADPARRIARGETLER